MIREERVVSTKRSGGSRVAKLAGLAIVGLLGYGVYLAGNVVRNR